MKLTNLHIFLIILFSLILCSALGRCSMEGFQNNPSPNDIENVTYAKYTGPNGYNAEIESVTVEADKDMNKITSQPVYHRRYFNNSGRNIKQNNNYSDNSDSKYHDYNTAYNGNNHLYKYKNTVKQGNMNGSMFNDNFQPNNNQQGIPKSQIPKAQEDLYILKSEIVPPVCPACPTVECSGACKDEKKCPPCPPCARCPEPQFECKKVPSYSSLGNSGKLPIPFMSDFSKFG